MRELALSSASWFSGATIGKPLAVLAVYRAASLARSEPSVFGEASEMVGADASSTSAGVESWMYSVLASR